MIEGKPPINPPHEHGQKLVLAAVPIVQHVAEVQTLQIFGVDEEIAHSAVTPHHDILFVYSFAVQLKEQCVVAPTALTNISLCEKRMPEKVTVFAV